MGAKIEILTGDGAGRKASAAARIAAALLAALAVSACSSSRFGDQGLSGPVARGPVYQAPAGVELEPAPAAPSGSVTSEPLAPPPGSEAADAGPGLGLPPTSEPRPVIQDTPPAPRVAAAPTRSTVVGGWTAQDASGTCRVQLSSAPALDLYRASASSCGNRELSRVTAWDFRDGEVFLYQPGGTVAARLRPSGGSMQGVFARSGGPLTLSR